MKLIRSLVIPWFLFFVLAIIGILALGLKYTHVAQLQTLQASGPKFLMAALGAGSLICLLINLNSLNSVGIWISESLPESLRYTSWRWMVRAFKSVFIAAIFWFIGQLPWAPLIWNAAVVPAVTTICLFVFVWSLVGPILKWSSNLAWSRAFSMIFSLPVFALVPVTAFVVGQMMIDSYHSSHPDFQRGPLASSLFGSSLNSSTSSSAKGGILASGSADEVKVFGRVLSVSATQLRLVGDWPMGSGESKILEVDLAQLSSKQLQSLPKPQKEVTLSLPPSAVKEASAQAPAGGQEDKDLRNRLRSLKAETRANALRALYESGKSCADFAKEIQLSLDAKASKNVVFWAVKDLDCAGLHSAVAMPRLVQIMTEHENPQVRAAAIRAMKHYGDESVRQVSYILVKRLGDNEPPEVVEAASSVLASLGGEHERRVTNRLKALLNVDRVSKVAAQCLIKDTKREDLVAEYVAQNLAGPKDARNRAVAMICLLPQTMLASAESHVSEVVASIQNADQNDNGIRALDCLGHAGFEAIRQEVTRPQQIDRSVAAHALVELDVKEAPETIETADLCVRDSNPQVRKWCSRSLGEVGAPALPKILELLQSSDSNLKEAGKNALQYFKDPSAESALRKIMTENSGWMANNRNLQIARAVGTAVQKIESQEALDQAGAEQPARPASGGDQVTK